MHDAVCIALRVAVLQERGSGFVILYLAWMVVATIRRYLACFRAQKKAKAILASIHPESTPVKYTTATERGEKALRPLDTAVRAADSGSAWRACLRSAAVRGSCSGCT